MHGAVRVDRVRVGVHRAEHFAGERLVAERPDEHARMVVIAAHHAVDTVHARALPLRFAARHGGFGGFDVVRNPAAVRFHIGLVDQVDAVFVAQVVPVFLVGVVRGADGVDVVPLAERDVVDHVLPGDGAAALRVEFVAVGALEDHALAVELHDAVFDAEATEADALRCGFNDRAIMADHHNLQFVQCRALGAPRLDVQRAGNDAGFVGCGQCGFPHHIATQILQRRRHGGGILSIAHRE